MVETSLGTLRRKSGEEADIAALDGLRTALAALSIAESTRYRLLVEQFRVIGWTGGPASPRVLLFTESRVTQEALVGALAATFGLTWSDRQEEQPVQVMAAIHGGLSDVWLGRTVEAFGTGTAAMRLLVATNVASEGVNLDHHCWHIIHYDLPWSIITLIQRNGRIDRFGQTHTPEIRYLMVRTEAGELQGDGAIFQRLIDKVDRAAVVQIEPAPLHHRDGDLPHRQRRRSDPQNVQDQPGQFARREPVVAPAHRLGRDAVRLQRGGIQPQHRIDMNQVRTALDDPLLQRGDQPGNLRIASR